VSAIPRRMPWKAAASLPAPVSFTCNTDHIRTSTTTSKPGADCCSQRGVACELGRGAGCRPVWAGRAEGNACELAEGEDPNRCGQAGPKQPAPPPRLTQTWCASLAACTADG
jgi:hypothetical protein